MICTPRRSPRNPGTYFATGLSTPNLTKMLARLECCREWVGRHGDDSPPASQQLGSWWSRDGQVEIDVAGVLPRTGSAKLAIFARGLRKRHGQLTLELGQALGVARHHPLTSP